MISGAPVAPEVPPELRLEDPGHVVEGGVDWLARYLERSGAACLVIGVSGGIDSSTTALWAARAVGAERLVLLALPCRTGVEGHEAEGDATERARMIAERVGDSDFRVLDVGPAVASEAWTCGVPEVLAPEQWSGPEGVVFGNLQARVRALRLRTFANARDGLVLGTGNLSERLLGYFTLGGDEETDLGVAGKLLKTELRQVARVLDVPEPILEATPSAGLLPGQTDEGELGFDYVTADRVLARVRELAGSDAVVTIPPDVRSRLEDESVEGVAANVVSRVLDRVDDTAFKRAARPVFDPGANR